MSWFENLQVPFNFNGGASHSFKVNGTWWEQWCASYVLSSFFPRYFICKLGGKWGEGKEGLS